MRKGRNRGGNGGPYSRNGQNKQNAGDAVLVIYTDGCALNNGFEDATGGIGVYYGPNNSDNISEPLFGDRQTNQRAELTAIIRALENEVENMSSGPLPKIVIRTDSVYGINCLTEWGDRWEANGWRRKRKRISNLDLIQEGRNLITEYTDSYFDRCGRRPAISFEHVRGHSGDPANEAADRLAKQGAGVD